MDLALLGPCFFGFLLMVGFPGWVSFGRTVGSPKGGGQLIVYMVEALVPMCRSGFTREYGGGGNGERRVEIGQQARPFRG